MTKKEAIDYIQANYDGEKLKCGDSFMYPYPVMMKMPDAIELRHGFYLADDGIIGTFEPLTYTVIPEIEEKRMQSVVLDICNSRTNFFK